MCLRAAGLLATTSIVGTYPPRIRMIFILKLRDLYAFKYEILCNMQLKFLKIDFKNKIEYQFLTQIIELSAATNIMIQRHT